jgi:hypothetical protein
MERNDDYLRSLLLELEASDDWMHLSVLTSGSDEAENERHFHIMLLVDAGLMAPMSAKMQTFRITNSGHDFLALTRQSERWEAAKSAVRHIGGASIQMLYRAAEGLARQKLIEMGVPLQ